MVLAVAITVAVPFVLSLVATQFVRSMATRRGFVDRPGGHKQHESAVALGGGIAVMLAIWLPMLLGALTAWLMADGPAPNWIPEAVRPHLSGAASKWPTVVSIFFCALLLHVVGLLDDRRAMGPWVKLIVQVGVAAIVAGPVGIRAMEALPTPASFAVTVFWIVLITNAFNFLDNMDGLSAGVAAIACAIFAIASAHTGQLFVPAMAWVIFGALLGFLVFNFSPASIFLGDAGSLPLGFTVAVLTILVTFYDAGRQLTPIGVFVPIVVLAVPLYDVTSVVIHRLRLGESPFRGDRRHFSHRLVRRGMTPRGAVLTIYLATAATALPAIVLPRVSWPMAALLLLQCICVVLMIAILEHIGATKTDVDSR